MDKKVIFMDLDGTIIDHTINDVPASTKATIANLQAEGHLVVIATGRPPALFYNIEKTLNIDTYIAANGRFVKHKGTVLLQDYIAPHIVDAFVKDMESRNIDVGFETADDYVIHKKTSDIVSQFSKHFHLEEPKEIYNFHQSNNVLQMIMFTDNHQQEKTFKKYPELDFNISCRYGIDINAQGGMKEVGVDVLINHLNVKRENTIAIGDGYNDIGMIKHVHIGIAMGNACQPLKDVADMVTDSANQDGIEKAIKKLNLL